MNQHRDEESSSSNNRNTDRAMGSSLPIEKLNRSNYVSWAYKMHQYVLRHGYWSYVEEANEVPLEPAHRDFPTWEQVAS